MLETLKKYCIALAILGLIVLGCYAYISLRTELHDQRGAIDEARYNLRSVAENQSEAASRIETVEKRVIQLADESHRISEGLGEVAAGLSGNIERIGEIEGELASGELSAAEGKRILDDVRKTGSARDK